jgi:hypothetical protein
MAFHLFLLLLLLLLQFIWTTAATEQDNWLSQGAQDNWLSLQ